MPRKSVTIIPIPDADASPPRGFTTIHNVQVDGDSVTMGTYARPGVSPAKLSALMCRLAHAESEARSYSGTLGELIAEIRAELRALIELAHAN